MRCHVCGSEIENGAKFCAKCGNPIAKLESGSGAPRVENRMPENEMLRGGMPGNGMPGNGMPGNGMLGGGMPGGGIPGGGMPGNGMPGGGMGFSGGGSTMFGQDRIVRSFQAEQTAGIIYLALMIGFAVGAVVCFVIRSSLSDNWLSEQYYAQERIILMIVGVGLVCLAVEHFFAWRSATKVKLILGERMVFGTMNPMGLFNKEFQWNYNEITEVTMKLGAIVLRVNGKWVAFRGLENKEMAMEMIEQRITGNYY